MPENKLSLEMVNPSIAKKVSVFCCDRIVFTKKKLDRFIKTRKINIQSLAIGQRSHISTM
eukprot:snap_masked-scaffold_3-processed-gene-15.53-mRNA-1 protein AED:1.00 eAED:1.00 QI:0/-1/0/0/-1/1/1/0/59